MNYYVMKNNQRINLLDIPTVNFESLRAQLIATNLRPIAFFGSDWGENIKLFVALADDEKGEILVTSSLIHKSIKEYESITKENSQYHMFEREFYEQFGIKPLNHPWLKPVRKNQDDYEFFEMQGAETHQVAVGPIHAGVIEPGHFRFNCQGEKVYNLEIMLGYQHRGVEDLMVKNPSNQLVESICGDSVIAYSSAYSQLIEALSETKITPRAEIIRRIALEMERIAIHIGDMGAILGDIAYLMGKETYAVTRTLVINTMLEVSGSRFIRGLTTVGGVNFDISADMSEKIISTLDYVKKTVDKMTNAALNSPTVISRLEKTGNISFESAQELNMVGLMARSCGLNIDSRFDFEDVYYKGIERKAFRATNDAYSRFRIRYKEVKDSIKIVKKLLEKLNKLGNQALITTPNCLVQNSFALSIVEGWRGEVVHIATTDESGKISRYKIKDPSFNNWWGLSIAVRNNGISDFPLCNKGFDLSYCGFDL
ncbi:MAG: NADH-quinone oxidoreductase subunit C [Candidatus Gastranaerophilales bacterium]|nr:NADH-quinone oxidoreductase subunit C [Candidatus Gastranaerophilales bacterium]